MSNAETFETPLHFDMRSRNRRVQYHLVAMRVRNGLNFTCTCDAARRGCICQHRLRLVAGNATSLVEPSERLTKLLSLISNTPLPKAVQELRNLETERGLIAVEINTQRQFIVGLMSS